MCDGICTWLVVPRSTLLLFLPRAASGAYGIESDGRVLCRTIFPCTSSRLTLLAAPLNDCSRTKGMGSTAFSNTCCSLCASLLGVIDIITVSRSSNTDVFTISTGCGETRDRLAGVPNDPSRDDPAEKTSIESVLDSRLKDVLFATSVFEVVSEGLLSSRIISVPDNQDVGLSGERGDGGLWSPEGVIAAISISRDKSARDSRSRRGNSRSTIAWLISTAHISTRYTSTPVLLSVRRLSYPSFSMPECIPFMSPTSSRGAHGPIS